MKRFLWFAAILLAWPAAASAITVDGGVDAGYFAPLAIQDTPTGFGNNLNELNAAYARLDASGNLWLMLTGNLDGNGGNRLVFFIDSRAGGAVTETLEGGYGKIGSIPGQASDDWGTDTDGGSGVNPTPGGGSILDPGFNPDIAFEIEHYGPNNRYYTHIIDLTLPNDPTVDDSRDVYLGDNEPGSTPSAAQTYNRPDGLSSKGSGGTVTHAFDNSNTAGVNGYDDGNPPGPLGDPLSATTGYEAMLSAAFLANDGQRIRILAFITNGGGDYLSNQFLGEGGGVHGDPNLGGATFFPGGTPLFDGSLYDGNQFFTVPIAGDFNHDGQVDEQDYVLWRKVDSSSDNYDTWRATYGNTVAASSSGLPLSTVPEAGTLALAAFGAVVALLFARRK